MRRFLSRWVFLVMLLPIFGLSHAQMQTVVEGYLNGDLGMQGNVPEHGYGNQVDLSAIDPVATPAVHQIKWLLGAVAPATVPEVRICRDDGANKPDFASCVAFSHTGQESADPTNTLWPSTYVVYIYEGDFPLAYLSSSANKHVWVLAQTAGVTTWITSNWNGSLDYTVAVMDAAANWTVTNEMLGPAVSLYHRPPSSTKANPDNAAGVAGTPIPPLDVLANDTTDGAPPTVGTAGNSVLSIVTPASDPGIALDVGTGLVTSSAAVPPGTYVMVYRLCSVGTGVCDTAEVTVVLTNPAGGPPSAVTAVPTIETWVLGVLASLLAAFGASHLRRRSRPG